MSGKPGIVDPWRIVEPVYQAPPAPRTPLDERKRIDLSEKDFDADMAPLKRGMLDSKHCALEVHGKKLHHMSDVLKNVVCCLFEVEHTFKTEFADIAYRIGERRSTGWDGTPAARWQTESGFEPICELRFKRQTIDGGMLRLVRALREFQRRPGGPAILNRWGVRIIQR